MRVRGRIIALAVMLCLLAIACGGGGGASAVQRGQRLHDQLVRAGMSDPGDAQSWAKAFGTDGGDDCKITTPSQFELFYNQDSTGDTLILRTLVFKDYCPSKQTAWLNVVGQHDPASRQALEDMLKNVGNS